MKDFLFIVVGGCFLLKLLALEVQHRKLQISDPEEGRPRRRTRTLGLGASIDYYL
eukprot:TRINITY_DN4788_c0_g1_i1.p2 TRINITY_DN4788_c0_g1~~TRINITY_DN4788_c0_g1_i1.p2  ORF type:complete len:55 (+),score=15.93 TRINITY_DN4788_c0_g1_i1:263-427(+)